MKKVLFILFISQWPCAKAQPVISLDLLNVLYVGINNPVTITCPGVRQEDLLVTITGERNEILHSHQNHYIVNVMDDSSSCVIRVWNRKKVLLGTYQCAIRKIPKGEVTFGTLKTGSYPLAEILAQEKMVYHNDASLSVLNESRITKYHLIIVPKKGAMSDFSVSGDVLGNTIRTHLAELHVGDLIIIEGIRARLMEAEIALPPFTISVGHPGTAMSGLYIEPHREEGYLLLSGKRIYYIYPRTEHEQFLNLSTYKKDSVWNYYFYNAERQDYQLLSKDSFDKGILVYSIHYSRTGGHLEYSTSRVDDSICNYTSYHPSGKIYQTGRVVKPTHYRQYFKSQFYEDPYYPVMEKDYNMHLKQVHEDYFPISEWKVYDSLGKLEMTISYSLIFVDYWPDLIVDPDYFYLASCQYFRVVPDGECIYYKSDGRIEKKIIYKDGIEVK